MSPVVEAASQGTARDFRRLQIYSRRLITGDMLGNYRSAFRGTGVIFSDIREYQPGDDVKHIHWKASARSGRVYVKSYDEDRQLRIVIAADTSASLRAPHGARAHQLLHEFCSLIITLAQRGSDLIGACLFAETVSHFLPPRSGPSRHHRILSLLSAPPPAAKVTDLGGALKTLAAQLRRPSIVFVVSDFFCAPFRAELRQLAHRHDVVLVQIPPLLDTLPTTGLTRFVDPESGTYTVVDTSNTAVRAAWARLLTERHSALEAIAKECSVDLISLRESAATPLVQLMRRRATPARH